MRVSERLSVNGDTERCWMSEISLHLLPRLKVEK